MDRRSVTESSSADAQAAACLAPPAAPVVDAEPMATERVGWLGCSSETSTLSCVPRVVASVKACQSSGNRPPGNTHPASK
jgi:hypothetical protein